MATEIKPAPFGEKRAASTAAGGTAVTNTAARIVLPPGTRYMHLIPRNFAGTSTLQWLPNPWLTVVKTTDGGATEANLTDYSYEAQDNSTSTSVTLSSLSTAANLDFLYVGSHIPFSGVAIDVDGTNANASVLTVKYRKNDNTWADISATDGTANAGATFGQDGNVTWTMPTDWTSARLFDTSDIDVPVGVSKVELFWTRWEVSAALDASVTLDHMLSINRSTLYAELTEGVGWEESVTVGPGGISCIQVKTDTAGGTANLIVNVAAGGMFP